MREVVVKKWGELKPIWNDLYDRNAAATPFQSYDFLTFTGRGKSYRKDPLRLFALREWNLVLYNDGEAVAIAPLLIKRKNGNVMVYLRGHFTVANQLDFIYSDWSYDDFNFLMDYITEKLGRASFFLDRVSEKTVSCQYLKQYFTSKRIEEHECFALPVAASYDEWLCSLNKSPRQNLSNRYHRLERDNIDWSVHFVCGERLNRHLCRQMMWVYADRFLIKNNYCSGPCRMLATRALQAYLLRDKMTRWMNRADCNFHAVLTINGEVAAFASGLACRDKRILLSRLAILTKYSKYSPGNILISATLRHIIEQNREGVMEIEQLDLSQGGQCGMSYKKALGGKPHLSYLFYE